MRELALVRLFVLEARTFLAGSHPLALLPFRSLSSALFYFVLEMCFRLAHAAGAFPFFLGVNQGGLRGISGEPAVCRVVLLSFFRRVNSLCLAPRGEAETQRDKNNDEFVHAVKVTGAYYCSKYITKSLADYDIYFSDEIKKRRQMELYKTLNDYDLLISTKK